MSITPLFISSMAVLKARLRLTAAAQSDTLAVLDRAVEETRIEFIYALGESRVTAILAIAYTENATTQAALVRTKANNVEASMVRLRLMRELPSLFMDASGAQNQDWNETSPFARRNDTDKEIARLESEIAEGLAFLSGEAEESSGVQGYSGTPKTTWQMGQSIAEVSRACI